MNKKYTVAIVAIIIAVIAIGGFLALNNSLIPESSELTDLFDYSIEPTTSWSDDKKEYSFSQSIAISILISLKSFQKSLIHSIMMWQVQVKFKFDF